MTKDFYHSVYIYIPHLIPNVHTHTHTTTHLKWPPHFLPESHTYFKAPGSHPSHKELCTPSWSGASSFCPFATHHLESRRSVCTGILPHPHPTSCTAVQDTAGHQSPLLQEQPILCHIKVKCKRASSFSTLKMSSNLPTFDLQGVLRSIIID